MGEKEVARNLLEVKGGEEGLSFSLSITDEVSEVASEIREEAAAEPTVIMTGLYFGHMTWS